MENMLTKGNRYTAEGLNEILMDLVRDPSERKAVINDILGDEKPPKVDPVFEMAKLFGLNIKKDTAVQQRSRQKMIERGTSAILNREVPLLNPNFKTLLKTKITEEYMQGKSKDEIREELKAFIGTNVQKLKQLK
jgi:hypothetical protein